jgi:hypothetical protein
MTYYQSERLDGSQCTSRPGNTLSANIPGTALRRRWNCYKASDASLSYMCLSG